MVVVVVVVALALALALAVAVVVVRCKSPRRRLIPSSQAMRPASNSLPEAHCPSHHMHCSRWCKEGAVAVVVVVVAAVAAAYNSPTPRPAPIHAER